MTNLRMKLSGRLAHPLKLKNFGITMLTLVVCFVLASLSIDHPFELDITAHNGNTLSAESQKLLSQLKGPIEINAYIEKGLPLRKQINQLINRFSRYKTDIKLTFIDPASQPERLRALDIGKEGAVIVKYQDKFEKISFLNETSLSNALLQLAYSKNHWLSFLTGHGERDALGDANFDIGEFGKRLQARHQIPQPLNLSILPDVPDNSAVLIIAGGNANLLEIELITLRRYLEKGGNLLVLADPSQTSLKPVLDELGVSVIPGIIVDNNAKTFGVNDPSFVVVHDYPNPHAITKNLETMSLFPEAAAFIVQPNSSFKSVSFLSSSAQAWNETGPIQGVLTQDAQNGEQSGPLNFGLALTRQVNDKQQRIVVLGDGDFLSNSYLGNVGNLELATRIIQWLTHDDNYIQIPARITPDISLKLSGFQTGAIGLGFLLILPLSLIGCGILIWRNRKRR